MKKPLSFLTIGVVSMLIVATSCNSTPEDVAIDEVETPIKKEVKPFFSSAKDFAKSFDKDEKLGEKLVNESFALYNEHKWAALEALFNKGTLNDGWPPANGGFNIVPNISLVKGQEYDRYSGAVAWSTDSVPQLGGQFTSPVIDDSPYSFGQRALNKPENDYDFYYEIEVMKELPFKAQNADVIPWFGQPGLGKQTMWEIPVDTTGAGGYPYTWNQLAEMGYIKVTIKSSPSGKYDKYVNTVIE